MPEISFSLIFGKKFYEKQTILNNNKIFSICWFVFKGILPSGGRTAGEDERSGVDRTTICKFAFKVKNTLPLNNQSCEKLTRKPPHEYIVKLNT